MHYGIICPNDKCRKVAFKLRPGLKPEDLQNVPLSMSHFVGKHPVDYIICPYCEFVFETKDFNQGKLRPLGE